MTELPNCFPRRLPGKPPGITGWATAVAVSFTCVRGGECARFDQVSSVYGKSLSRAAPFYVLFRQPWGGERRWPSIICSKWHLSLQLIKSGLTHASHKGKASQVPSPLI